MLNDDRGGVEEKRGGESSKEKMKKARSRREPSATHKTISRTITQSKLKHTRLRTHIQNITKPRFPVFHGCFRRSTAVSAKMLNIEKRLLIFVHVRMKKYVFEFGTDIA